jgi:hypothetical protein
MPTRRQCQGPSASGGRIDGKATDTGWGRCRRQVRPGLPPLRQIFPGQRRGGRLGLHHDARHSPAAGFFDRFNAVDAARDLLAVAVQRVATP